MSTLPQNDQMDYFHPLSKLGPGLKYHKAKQLRYLFKTFKMANFCILREIY